MKRERKRDDMSRKVTTKAVCFLGSLLPYPSGRSLRSSVSSFTPEGMEDVRSGQTEERHTTGGERR